MRIGVEEAVHEDLLEQDSRSGHGHIGRIDPHRADALQVIDADPFNELHGDHAGGRKGVDRIRNMGGGVAGELALAALHGPALDCEVELPLEAALEFTGQRQRFVGSQESDPALGELGQVLEDVEIGLDDLGDIRSADLQRHSAAVAEDRAVNLRDRGRSHRDRIKREEDFLGRPLIILGEDLLDFRERKRPYVVSQRGKFNCVRFGDDVRPGAQDLAQLDEGWSQFLADQLQPARAILGGGVPAHRHALDRAYDPFQVERSDHVVVAVADQGGQDLPVPRKIAEMADSFSQQGIMAFAKENASSRLCPGASLHPARPLAVHDLPWRPVLLATGHVRWEQRGRGPGDLSVLRFRSNLIKLRLMIHAAIPCSREPFHADQGTDWDSSTRVIRRLLGNASRSHRIHFSRYPHSCQEQGPTLEHHQSSPLARCPKLEKIGDGETKIWFKSVRIAHKHLDETVGAKRWRWCKLCEREITQRVLDES